MVAQKPIFWHQGLFLQPQHMQLSDLWISSELQLLKNQQQAYFWGVSLLEFDEQALQANKLTLNRGQFLFKDGTLAAYPGNSLIASRSLDRVSLTGDAQLMVYLTVKSWDNQGKNTVVVDDQEAAVEAKTRFVVLTNPEKVVDTLGNGPEADIQFLHYNLCLRFSFELENETMESYQSLPLARLIRQEGKIVLDQSYIPPCHNLEDSGKLKNIFKNLTELLVSHTRQLEGYKSPEQVDTEKPDMSYLVLFMALRTLSRYSAICTHIQEAEQVHPWQAYGVIRQLVAELSTFSLDVDILGYDNQDKRLLPAYDHNELFVCFNSGFELAVQIIETIGSGPEMLLNMQYEAPFYRVQFPERVLKGGRSFWLVLKTEQDANWVFDSVARLVKISPASGMTTILSQAVSGIPLSGQSRPPAGLPRQANAFYFKIHTDCALWKQVCESRELSMFWDEAPEDLSAQIAVLGR